MTDELNRIFFREAIRGPGRGETKIARRRGMRNEYAHVRVNVRPADRGRGVILEWNAGANIPAFFSSSVLRGIQDALQAGIAGLEVTDITVNVETGSYHDVDSNEAVFREMAHKATLQAIEQAGSIDSGSNVARVHHSAGEASRSGGDCGRSTLGEKRLPR